MTPVPPLDIAILLVAVALFAGVCITTIGPGGIFLTVALFVLLPVPPATVAGTASATFVATGLLGSAAYVRSGELDAGPPREAAVVLSAASVLGALTGTRLNLLVSAALFELALAGFVAAIGGLIVYREVVGIEPAAHLDTTPRRRRTGLAAIGFGIGVAGGLLGVGGPVLAVPVLVVLGVPMLIGVAVAQVQSVFLSAFATLGYAAVGAVSWPLVALVGLPQLVGALLGWRVAHVVPVGRLRVLLGIALVATSAIVVT